MAETILRNIVRYRGHVQGVGFRMTAIAQGRGLSIHGFVRNEADGSVLMDVEGPSGDVKHLLARISSAMDHHLEETVVEERPPRGIQSGLRIEY